MKSPAEKHLGISNLVGWPAEVFLQVADDLPVHVVDGRGKKQQRAMIQRVVAPGRTGRMRGIHCAHSLQPVHKANQLYNPPTFSHFMQMNLKKFLPFLQWLLLAGCATGEFTRLTPQRPAAQRQQPFIRSRRGLPRSSSPLRWDSVKGVCHRQRPAVCRCVRCRW